MPRRKEFTTVLCAVAIVLVSGSPAKAVPCYGVEQLTCTYANTPGAMYDDIGPLLLGTTFQTWPDGTPTVPGQELTPEMNYTQLGVTFSAPIGYPFIRNAAPFQALAVNSGGTYEPDWIIADFVTPASAIGIWFPSETTLYAFDGSGNLIADVSYFFPGGQDLFLGISSGIPIARAIVNRGVDVEIVDTFAFNVIPEPSIVALLGAGLAGIARPRRRWRQV